MVASAGRRRGAACAEARRRVRCRGRHHRPVGPRGAQHRRDEVRPTSTDGDFAGFSPWETAFCTAVAELMESTGKPIINVPDMPIRGSLFQQRRALCAGRPLVASGGGADVWTGWPGMPLSGRDTREDGKMSAEELAEKVATSSAASGPVIEILSGNEAIARGAWEAGVRLASAYPGTPSTEILEALARLRRRLLPSGRPTRRWPWRWRIGAVDGRRPGSGLHEARGPQRGRRSLLLRLVYRRGGRPGGRLRRRPGHAQLAGRAGQPQLRQVRQGAAASSPRTAEEAKAFMLAAYELSRALRHARALPHDHSHLALQEHGRVGRAAAPT